MNNIKEKRKTLITDICSYKYLKNKCASSCNEMKYIEISEMCLKTIFIIE